MIPKACAALLSIVAATSGVYAAEMTRERALIIFEKGATIPGTAALCVMRGYLSESELKPFADWNRRHDAILREAVDVVKRTGDMTQEAKERLDKSLYKQVEQAIEVASNKESYCASFRSDVAAGKYDIE